MARELGQDARDLVALVALELAQAVGELDDRERLDEQRLARVAGVVDDAGHGAARARAHGDDGPSAALGDEIFLQMGLEIGIRRERAQAVAGPPPRGRELGAQRLELGRGRVLDARRVELERALEPVGDRSASVSAISLARAASSGTDSLALGQMPRTPSAARAVSAIATRPSAPSDPPRPACSASARTSCAPDIRGGPCSTRIIASAQSACRARDLAGLRRGQSDSASARLAEKDVWFASRSRIAASSSTSSA